MKRRIRLLTQALEENATQLRDRSGRSGLAEAERTQPNLVVLDAMLPGMDGFEFLRHLRTKVDTQFDADGPCGRGRKVKGLDAGADDYLAKPFRLEELLARVFRATSSAKQSRCHEHLVRRSEHRLISGG